MIVEPASASTDSSSKSTSKTAATSTIRIWSFLRSRIVVSFYLRSFLPLLARRAIFISSILVRIIVSSARSLISRAALLWRSVVETSLLTILGRILTIIFLRLRFLVTNIIFIKRVLRQMAVKTCNTSLLDYLLKSFYLRLKFIFDLSGEDLIDLMEVAYSSLDDFNQNECLDDGISSCSDLEVLVLIDLPFAV